MLSMRQEENLLPFFILGLKRVLKSGKVVSGHWDGRRAYENKNRDSCSNPGGRQPHRLRQQNGGNFGPGVIGRDTGCGSECRTRTCRRGQNRIDKYRKQGASRRLRASRGSRAGKSGGDNRCSAADDAAGFHTGTDKDADPHACAHTDADPDTDGDAYSDTDGDADADTDERADADTDERADAGADGRADTGADGRADAGADRRACAGTDGRAGTGTDSGA